MIKDKVYIITECPYGGILTSMVFFAKNLKIQKIKMAFILPTHSRDRFGEEIKFNLPKLEELGEVFFIDIKKGYLNIIKDTVELKNFIIVNKVNYMLSHGSYSGKLCRSYFP